VISLAKLSIRRPKVALAGCAAYVRGEPGSQPVMTGLRETAAPATGAGIVMIAAVAPFVTADPEAAENLPPARAGGA
jgi:hypothetical protein